MTGRPECSPAGQRLIVLLAGASAVQGLSVDHAAKKNASKQPFLLLHTALSSAKPQPPVHSVHFFFLTPEVSYLLLAQRTCDGKAVSSPGGVQQPECGGHHRDHRRSRRPSALHASPAGSANLPEPLCLMAAVLPWPAAPHAAPGANR